MTVKVIVCSSDSGYIVFILQVGVWFTYGCAALACDQHETAAHAFRTCVALDSDVSQNFTQR